MRKTLLVCLSYGLFLAGPMFFPRAARAAVVISTSSVNFGSVAVHTTSKTATLLVTNGGSQTVSILRVSSTLPEFIVSGPALPLALAPHARAIFHVIFRPDAALLYRGQVVFYESRLKGGTQIVSLLGTGKAAVASSQTYLLSANASSLNFGNILLGTSSSRIVSLTNAGTGSVRISQAAITGAGFSVAGFSGAVTLAAGQSLSLTVHFAPANVGSVTGNLGITSSATNSPVAIRLSGAGVQALMSVIPASAAFGNVVVGLTNTQTLTIKNPGAASLSVNQASLVGAGFGFSGPSLPLTVSPGGSAAFTVSFKPASASAYSGSFTLAGNAPNSPLVVALSGKGISSTLELTASPSSLSFGSVAVGATASQSVTLANVGNSSVSISKVGISGTGFRATSLALPLTLAAGQSASFAVTFAPTATGSLSGSATVTSSATNSPATISLSGSGAPVSHSVALSWAPSSSSYAGFNVYRGSQSGGPYTKLNSALVSAAAYTDTSVVGGQSYWYVITEVDAAGAESAYSNQVSATIP